MNPAFARCEHNYRHCRFCAVNRICCRCSAPTRVVHLDKASRAGNDEDHSDRATGKSRSRTPAPEVEVASRAEPLTEEDVREAMKDGGWTSERALADALNRLLSRAARSSAPLYDADTERRLEEARIEARAQLKPLTDPIRASAQGPMLTERIGSPAPAGGTAEAHD